MNEVKKRIVIVGGGFAAIACVQKLIKDGLDRTHQITLISDKAHFEYHATLYRLVAGGSSQEACVPLTSLIRSKHVRIVRDEVVAINANDNVCTGRSLSEYPYEYCVIAVGSKTSYKDIPGLEKNAYSFKSFAEAIELKKHLHQTFEEASHFKTDGAQATAARITVVGGGASGVELAAELSNYVKALAKNHSVKSSNVVIDLIQSRDRLLPELPRTFTKKITQRLASLGVNLILNHRVVKEDFNTVFLNDSQIQSKTLIWTAGVSLPEVITSIDVPKTPSGLIEINEYLQVSTKPTMFVTGDNTKTPFAGMAQTAIVHGQKVATNIALSESGQPLQKNIDQPPIYAVPLGKKWAAVKYKHIYLYGYSGWIVRRLLDLKVFMTLLPFWQALRCYAGGFSHLESCSDCQ
jgi:NADH dehydrogenase